MSHYIDILTAYTPAQRDPYPSTRFFSNDARLGDVSLDASLLDNSHRQNFYVGVRVGGWRGGQVYAMYKMKSSKNKHCVP